MNIEIVGSGSSGNCYIIKDEKTTLLIECGLSFTTIQKALKFKNPDACMITHEHIDHSRAAKELIKRNVNIFCSKGTADAIGIKGHRVHEVNDEWQEVGTFEIRSFKTVHDASEPVGFLIRNNIELLLFITDTAYVKQRFTGVTHLMIECNYIKENLDRNVIDGYLNVNLRNRIVKNHMSLETLLEFISVNNWDRLSEIYILHLSDNNSDEEVIKNKVQEATGRPVVIC